MNDDLKVIIQTKFDIDIIDIKFHNSKWITLTYKFLFIPKDIIGAHLRIKNNIKDFFISISLPNKYKGIRILNYSIKQKRISNNLTRRTNKIVSIKEKIDDDGNLKSSNIGFMARSLVMASMPHSKKMKTIVNKKGENIYIEDNECYRVNGKFSLTMISPSKIGLPYGSKARLILSFIVKEAITKKSKRIELGNSLKDFMSKIGYPMTGGDKGTIKSFVNQINRLFSTTIIATYDDDRIIKGKNVCIASEYSLWWDVENNNHINTFDCYVELDQTFFDEIINCPIPVDIRALEAIKNSSLAIDIYSFLTYRLSYLKYPTVIRWEDLAIQFGSEYNRIRDFKKKFIYQLKKVNEVYSTNIRITEIGLQLNVSKPHIKKTTK